MCDSNSKPKYKAGDKVKCIQAGANQYINEGEVYTVKNIINGFIGEYLVLEEIQRSMLEFFWRWVDLKEDNLDATSNSVDIGIFTYSLDDFELVKQTPKNYRELTPDTLIDISIDGNEFKIPLGDLIHAKALIGVANGLYG